MSCRHVCQFYFDCLENIYVQYIYINLILIILYAINSLIFISDPNKMSRGSSAGFDRHITIFRSAVFSVVILYLFIISLKMTRRLFCWLRSSHSLIWLLISALRVVSTKWSMPSKPSTRDPPPLLLSRSGKNLTR